MYKVVSKEYIKEKTLLFISKSLDIVIFMEYWGRLGLVSFPFQAEECLEEFVTFRLKTS